MHIDIGSHKQPYSSYGPTWIALKGRKEESSSFVARCGPSRVSSAKAKGEGVVLLTSMPQELNKRYIPIQESNRPDQLHVS